MNNHIDTLPVAVIGAGPVGLAAGAHLLERGIEPVVLEAAPVVAQHFREYGHVQLFSPWRYNLDEAMTKMLDRAGWRMPDPEALPTAGDVVYDYLEPFSRLDEMSSRIRLDSRVNAVSRRGLDKVKTRGREMAPFEILYTSSAGVPQQILARAVIDASGTWSSPNPAGANGIPALGEKENRDRIFYGIPDIPGGARTRYAGRSVLVIGSGHSAANSLLALAELADSEPATALLWAVRGTDLRRIFGGGVADALPARGRLGTALKELEERGRLQLFRGFHVTGFERAGHRLNVLGRNLIGDESIINEIDEVIVATGQRPDYTMAGELRLKLDTWLESTEALGPLIDPNEHSCGTVRPHGYRELAHPEPGFYTAGVKSYGRAPTFLLATGYEQVRSIAAALAGDWEAANEVRLNLPETGVCTTDFAEPAAACCSTSSPSPSACDITLVQGCGLSSVRAEEPVAACGCNA